MMHAKFVQAPWCVYTHFMLVFFPDRDEVKRTRHINLGKQFTSLDVIGEVVEVGQGVGSLDGDVVQGAKISTRTFRSIWFRL